MIRLPKEIAEVLEEVGIPYEVKLGGRHMKIMSGGHLLGIMSKGGKGGREVGNRSILNLVHQIRRFARERSSIDSGSGLKDTEGA
jgi:hypothetical protein